MRKILIFLMLLVYGGLGCASGTSELKKEVKRWEKERNTEELIETLESDTEDWFIRIEAARALGRIADPLGIEALVGMFRDKNRYMRQEVIGILDRVGQPATDNLIVMLKEPESGMAYKAAVETLIRIGRPATDSLVGALRNRDSDIRRAAAGTLKKIGWRPDDDQGKAYLLAALNDWGGVEKLGGVATRPLMTSLNHKNGSARRMAAWLLGKVGDQRAVAPLSRLLGDNDSLIRDAAAKALGQIGGNQALDPLAITLHDRAPFVRRSAAWALGEIGDSQGAAPLVAALGDNEQTVREAIIGSLVKIGRPAVKPLINSYNEAGFARTKAAMALEELWMPAVKPVVKPYTKPRIVRTGALEEIKEPEVRPLVKSEIVRSEPLGEIGKSAVKPFVIPENDRPEAEEEAGKPFVKPLFKPRIARTEPLELFEKPAVKPVVKPRIVRKKALDETEKTAVKPLIKSYNQAMLVRRQAAMAMGRIGDPLAVDPLLNALEQKYHDDREVTVWALGEIGDPRAFKPVSSLIGNNRWKVRRVAAEALGKFGDSRAIELLEKPLDDVNPAVRNAAAWSLERLGGLRQDVPTAAKAYRYFMKKDDKVELLTKAIEQYGNAAMAESFMNSKSAELKRAAKAWAEKNGHIITVKPTGVTVQSSIIHADSYGGSPIARADLMGEAEATVTEGDFRVLPAAADQGLNVAAISGHATMVRGLRGETMVSVEIKGLNSEKSYATHVHNLPCDLGGGSHYKIDTSVAGTEKSNEIWPTVRTNHNGRGKGRANVLDHRARPEAQSVVIHATPNGGPPIACADLN